MFAQLVGGYSVKWAVPLDWYGLDAIGIDGVFATFAQEVEPVGFQVFHQVPALDGQATPR